MLTYYGVQQEVKLYKSMLMLNSKIGSQNLLSILCFRSLFQVWDQLSMILWQIRCLHAKWFTRDSFHKWNYVATEIAVLCLGDLVLLINFQILLLHILNIQQKIYPFFDKFVTSWSIEINKIADGGETPQYSFAIPT